jgi:carboxynorspermidine decarboxylase
MNKQLPDFTNLSELPSPAFVVDLGLLENNLRVLDSVQQRTGASILLALKGFALWETFPLVRRYLKGITASGLHEALLGHYEFRGEVHVYSPAFRNEDITELCRISDHLVFNSPSQLERFLPQIRAQRKQPSLALRINPEHREVAVELYDPCSPNSRLGTKLSNLQEFDWSQLDGIHFHTLCQLNSDALERTLDVVEKNFGHALHAVDWVNFGGGHHITRPDYDIDRLCRLIDRIRSRYNVDVYLEPGEAVALNTGFLVCTVLDIIPSPLPLAILDTSATTHMPDVLEMPYRPEIIGAGKPGEFPHVYRFGGMSCLAGDVIGDYAFPAPLQIGQRLVFTDMGHYTMVKTTTFNGVPLPSIALWDPAKHQLDVVRRFGYNEFRNRLG